MPDSQRALEREHDQPGVGNGSPQLSVAGGGEATTSSPSTASLSLTGSRLKAQLDASRRPPQIHRARRVVSSHSTPRKKREHQQPERPKTVAETRSSSAKGRKGDQTPTSRLGSSPTKAPSPHRAPEKCPAPTPSPSRSNSTTSNFSKPGRTSPAKVSGSGQHVTTQPSPEASPKRRTPSKLKLRDSLSPAKMPSTPASARSLPDLHVSGHTDPIKRHGPKPSACASPSKRTPPKLKLRRSIPSADLTRLGRSSSPKSPAKSSPDATAGQPCPSPGTAADDEPSSVLLHRDEK